MKSLITLTTAVAAALIVHTAGADSTVSEDLFLGEVPQVLSATRLRQPLSETPAAVTVIDRQMIEASGVHTIPDLLRLVPGFQVGHDGNNWTTATYHGLGDNYSRRMQVLVDGRSVYTPAFGGVVWVDLPLLVEDIERIEVIRGPNGVTYGANSFSAVINIVSRAPGSTTGASLKHEGGDLGTRRTIAGYDAGDATFRYCLTAGYTKDDGLAHPDIVNGQRTRHFNFRGDYRASDRDTFDILLGYADGPRDDGERDESDDPAREREMDANYQQLVWQRRLGDEENIRVNFYHTYQRSLDTYDAAGTRMGIPFTATRSEDLTTERFDLEFQHTTRLWQSTRFVWGAEWRRDGVTGPGWFNTDNTLYSDLSRLFANAEWRIAPDWIANVGAMYEHNDVTGGDISPRLALNYRLQPNHTLRAAYSRAYRTPSFIESQGATQACLVALGTTMCFPYITGESELEPERIDSHELGYLGTFADGALVVDVKVFREEYRDLIAWTNSPNGLIFSNDGSADTRGWETQIEWRPGSDTRVVLAHARAKQYGRFLASASPPDYQDTDDSTPRNTSSVLLIQKLPLGFEASAAYYRFDNMRWLDQGEDDQTGDIRTFDARLAYKLRQPGFRGTLAVVGRNLNGDYFDYRKAWSIDQQIYFAVSVELR